MTTMTTTKHTHSRPTTPRPAEGPSHAHTTQPPTPTMSPEASTRKAQSQSAPHDKDPHTQHDEAPDAHATQAHAHSSESPIESCPRKAQPV